MILWNQDGFLSWSIFESLEDIVDKLLSSIDNKKDTHVKLATRISQLKQCYEALREVYLLDPTVLTYSKIMVDFTMVTTRIAELAWASMKDNELLSKLLITEIYNIHEVFKHSLEDKLLNS